MGIKGNGRVYPRFCIRVHLADGKSRFSEIIFGGRYYSRNHKYYPDDLLTITLLQFKKRYVKVIDEYYDRAICFLNDQSKIDVLYSVPQNPKDIVEQKFDRFTSLRLQ